MDTNELIWLAEVTHPQHGRKVHAWRSQGAAERWVKHWRRAWGGGSVPPLYRIELIVLES